jgi:hypothetical protein
MTVLYTILVQSSMPLNRVNFEGPFVSFDSIRTQAKVHYSETVQVQVSSIYKGVCLLLLSIGPEGVFGWAGLS